MARRPPRVLVTRSPDQASELADRLRALGVEPVLIPTIEIAEPTSFAALDAALAQLERFHWLIFTSANAVDVFPRRATRSAVILTEARSEDRAKSKNLRISSALTESQTSEDEAEPPLLPGVPHIRRIAAIGPSTARALEAAGLAPPGAHVLVPPQAVAESLTEALLPHARQPDGSPTRFLLLRAESVGDTPPREHLPETLRAAGAEVTVVPVYRTVPAQDSIPALRSLFQRETAGIDAITFTSSSTVHNLVALCAAAGVVLPPSALRISIGPITSQTLREAGLPPHAEAPEASVASVAETAVKALQTAWDPALRSR